MVWLVQTLWLTWPWVSSWVVPRIQLKSPQKRNQIRPDPAPDLREVRGWGWLEWSEDGGSQHLLTPSLVEADPPRWDVTISQGPRPVPVSTCPTLPVPKADNRSELEVPVCAGSHLGAVRIRWDGVWASLTCCLTLSSAPHMDPSPPRAGFLVVTWDSQPLAQG